MVALATAHSYYFTHLYSHDEIWIYGFGTNIVDGLIPYKDFNMVITPFFPYLLSIVLSIFGKKLLIYHIFIAFIVVLITYLASKKLKIYSILIYIALLIYSTNGYNTSTLLWLLLLLTILDRNEKYKELLIPIIIGIMILTKQTMILLIIPSLIYSKNKKKTLSIYLIIALFYIIYLLMNNNFIEFFDYCLFGMFDFANNNATSSRILLIIQTIMCISLVIELIKSKFRKQEIFYVLLYQVITMPILEIYHFVLVWCAYIYIIFGSKQIKEITKNALFIFLIIIEACLVFTTNEMFTIRDSQYFEHYPKKESFMYGRMSSKVNKEYSEKIKKIIKNYPNYEIYMFGNYSYIAKLELNIPINKFDLINNGNMGYNGSNKYIKEIKKKCSHKKCLFIIDDNELTRKDYTQVNKDILNYVVKNTTKIYSSNIIGAYIN